LEDATYYPVSYNYRCGGIGEVVSSRSRALSRPTEHYCFGLGTTVCFDRLGTNMQPVRDRPQVVDSISPTNRWPDRTNECLDGTVPLGVR
jgi:hypothetical protein